MPRAEALGRAETDSFAASTAAFAGARQSETLQRLLEMGSAHEQDPGVSL